MRMLVDSLPGSIESFTLESKGGSKRVCLDESGQRSNKCLVRLRVRAK
jgi:hypothetical protein